MKTPQHPQQSYSTWEQLFLCLEKAKKASDSKAAERKKLYIQQAQGLLNTIYKTSE